MRAHHHLTGSSPAALLAALLAAMPLLAAVAPAHASADIDCYPDLRVKHSAFSRCNTMSAMSPGNDTRADLLLMLFDRDAPAPNHVPPRTPPAQPLAPDAAPLLFWNDFRDRFYDPKPTNTDTSFADGEGSRCRGDASGTAAFVTAINADPAVPADERATLIAARKAFAPQCADKDPQGAESPATAEVDFSTAHSPTGLAFATYLRGAKAFYEGRFPAARDAFAKLHGTANPWLGNTADYMVARTDVNQLQAGAFDRYGDFAGSEHVDQAVATRATASLEGYLRDHRDGSYAASARGLRRRVDWLSGRTEALAAAYSALIARPLAERGIDDATLAEEIGAKLLPSLKPEMTRDPILLAALDLQTMRNPQRGPGDPQGAATAPPPPLDLEAQRAAFGTATALFDYVAATQALYIDNDPNKALQLLPDDTRRRGGDHLWFSRQILRGLALEAKGDRNTRGFWKEFHAAATRPLDQLTVQLALALHDERAGALDDVFARGSIVTSPRLRQILLESIADAALLRREARDADVPERERQIALFTLLYKEVTRGRYAEFVTDVAMVPADAPTGEYPSLSVVGDPPPLGLFTEHKPGDLDCPPLPTTAAQLTRDPRAARARLCIAEYARVNMQDQDPLALDTRPSADDLGGGPSLFPGQPYARSAIYQEIIADKAAPAADRAYALYRAISCYASSGVNHCGGKDVPKTRRKAWYDALKQDYPDTRWAKELAYWW